jgi:LCP family protein required for cell wall assembly
MLSAGVGALLAISFSTTPLLQRHLTPEEAAIFNKGGSISKSGLQMPELTRPVNILVMGMSVLTADVPNPPPETQNLSYQAQVNSFDGLSDVMLLVRFDPESETVTALSIPRDTQVEMEGYGTIKINAANVNGGPAASARLVSQLLEDVPIDRYVRVYVEGVQKLVDALGGVTVYIPKDMKYKDDSQHLYINLKEGKQHLDGDQTLQLLRFRYGKNGDIGRIQRQQMVLRALMKQTLNPMTLARVPKIYDAIESNLDTNLSVEELLALVGFAAKTDRKNVQMLMLPGWFNGDGRHEVSYWLPNHRRIQGVMAQYFGQGDGSSQEANLAEVSIVIQDSTGSDRDAVRALVHRLRAVGYRNVRIDEAWNEPLRVTRLVAQQGNDNIASAIRDTLGFGKVRVESTGSLVSDVTIRLGKDWLPQ